MALMAAQEGVSGFVNPLHLKHYERNPRKNDHAVERMAKLIERFGFRYPVLVRKGKAKGAEHEIVDGHLRVKAAVMLGMQQIPILDISDMSEDDVKAFRLAVNRAATMAGWDPALLALELRDLTDAGVDLSVTAFDMPEIAGYLKTLEPKVPPAQFQQLDENIETKHTCPKCGYEWS